MTAEKKKVYGNMRIMAFQGKDYARIEIFVGYLEVVRSSDITDEDIFRRFTRT